MVPSNPFETKHATEHADMARVAGQTSPQISAAALEAPSRATNSAESVIRPTYGAAFRCIGPACEDTCCHGWSIPVDKATYRKYQQFPIAGLGSLVAQYVSISPTPVPDSLYARIHQASSGSCPFFLADRLCGIQKEYGSQLLSATCSIYPRSLNQVDGVLEGSLTLSCPEAARNVLLCADPLQITGNLLAGEFRIDNAFRLASAANDPVHKPYLYFHAIRALLVDLVRDRARPLWQRLILIGSLCKHLDGITSAEHDGAVPAILEEFRQILRNNLLRAELDAMPVQPALKLKVVLRLTDERVRDSTCGNRFRDTFWSFVEGIGSSDNAAAGEDLDRFVDAERKYHRPFFERSPFILENYLLNYIFQNLFPFGRTGGPDDRPQRIFDAYLLMTTQFAWINALLVGVAGRYREEFGTDHVVHTIQSFCRAVEHYPDVLASINDYMTAWQLDSLHGMSVLLRD